MCDSIDTATSRFFAWASSSSIYVPGYVAGYRGLGFAYAEQGQTAKIVIRNKK